jgi:hypothetical protein
LTDFFPLLLMFYAVVGNLAFSLFMETEVFVWVLIVIVLFETTPRSDPAEVVPRHATNHPAGLAESGYDYS